MSDSAIAPVRPERPNVRTDCSWYPRAFFTNAEIWHGAVILTGKGKAEFRKFVELTVRLPPEGSPERKDIQDEIQRAFDLWVDMNGDPGYPDEEQDGQDAVVDRWARSGVLPPLAEAIAELSLEGLTDDCTEFAMQHFPGWAERAAEREELASYRVERWIKATSPFRDRDWVNRPELWTAYETWCKFDGNGQTAGQSKDFYAALKELGCQPKGRNGKNGFTPPAARR